MVVGRTSPRRSIRRRPLNSCKYRSPSGFRDQHLVDDLTCQGHGLVTMTFVGPPQKRRVPIVRSRARRRLPALNSGRIISTRIHNVASGEDLLAPPQQGYCPPGDAWFPVRMQWHHHHLGPRSKA
jgi:hypothetical protein